MDINRLRECVLKIRNVFLSMRSELGFPFDRFPTACCGDSVLLLGAFLEDQGFGSFYRFSGERGDRSISTDDWCSHAWAFKNDVIVDITSDQFRDYPGEFVIEGTSAFHQSFKQVGESYHATYLNYDEGTQCRIGPIYELIMDRYATA